MDLFRTAVLAITALIAAAKLLAIVAAFQRKEYRLDRLRAALIDGEFTAPAYLYGLHAIAAGLSANLNSPLLAALIASFAVVSEACYRTVLLVRIGLHRPRFTAKAQLVLYTASAAVLLEWLILTALQYPALTAAAILLVSVPALTLLSVSGVNQLANLRKRRVIAAAARLRAQRNITVIGVTGSYGKTSTKHFLQQLLPQAVVSARHRNEAYVIAEDMLQQLSGTAPQYITEFGAYRRGEIAALTRLTQPTIGVITAIGNQHLALFGSQKNLTAAKWELIAALPSGGIAVLNADDPRLKRKAADRPGRIIWFSTSQAADVRLTEMEIAPTTVTIRLEISRQECIVKLPLAGRGALANVAAAAASAWAAGAVPADICERLTRIRPYPRTMEVRQLSSGATLIDDSYSANEQGALDAIEHLARFPQADKRILLLPLIELGSAAGRVHRRLGRALAKSNAASMVYTRRHFAELMAGAARENPAYRIRNTNRSRAALAFVSANTGPDTVILLENRIPDVVRQELQ